jgi:hypothetical protein
MVVDDTAVTAVKGLIELLPIKSPTLTTDVGSDDTVMTPVAEFIDEAVMPVDTGSAPTH